MKYIYLRCPKCQRLLAVGAQHPDYPNSDNDDGTQQCWLCDFNGTMPWRKCGGEGKRATVLDMMKHEVY